MRMITTLLLRFDWLSCSQADNNLLGRANRHPKRYYLSQPRSMN
jgi:hypothetical protein